MFEMNMHLHFIFMAKYDKRQKPNVLKLPNYWCVSVSNVHDYTKTHTNS